MMTTRTIPIAFAWICAAATIFLCRSETRAQESTLFEDPFQVSRDYFTKDVDRGTAALLRSVERYHLAEENYWKVYKEGNLDMARGSLDFVLRYIPNHPTALHLMGQVSAEMRQEFYPIVYYERALRLYPTRAYTRAQYGRFLVTIGHVEAGLRELDEALRLDPSLLVAQAWRAGALAQRDRTKP